MPGTPQPSGPPPQRLNKLLPRLLESGLLQPGDALTAHGKRDLQAEVRADGTLLLNVWGRPMSLQAATSKAREIEVWGHVPFTPKVRAANPLHFWTYYDHIAQRDERLKRLADLLDSSLDFKAQGCNICDADFAGRDDERARDDVLVAPAFSPFRLVVAPIFHFTDRARMPMRDLRRLDEVVAHQVQIGLAKSKRVTVAEQHVPSGHLHYALHSEPDFAW